MSELIRKYAVTHKTHYEYSSPSSLCHNQMHLRPRNLPFQRVYQSNVEISPKPDSRYEWIDCFGNESEFFSIEHNESIAIGKQLSSSTTHVTASVQKSLRTTRKTLWMRIEVLLSACEC